MAGIRRDLRVGLEGCHEQGPKRRLGSGVPPRSYALVGEHCGLWRPRLPLGFGDRLRGGSVDKVTPAIRNALIVLEVMVLTVTVALVVLNLPVETTGGSGVISP